MQIKRHLFQLLLFAFTILNSSFFILNSAALAAGVLPDTGQTKCYNSSGTEIPCAGTGQDGAYSGYPMLFTDNGNGTITDNNTGLVWQQANPGVMTWYNALTYCQGLILGGADDWRLPSKKELVGIVDYSIPYPGPTIQQSYFPNTVSSYYWTSTICAYATNLAWGVDFSDGHVDPHGISPYVRCVRGGQ